MNAIIAMGTSAKEIAALVLALQERRETSQEIETLESDRESLIHQYEQRLAKLKTGASPGDVIL